MEYIYAIMLLHKAGKEINENNIKKVLEAAGVMPDETKIKALVAALSDVNIDKAIEEAAIPAPVAAPAEKQAVEKKPEEKEEKKKEEADAAAGLGSLFA